LPRIAPPTPARTDVPGFLAAADKLDIDLAAAAEKKLALNAKKYPVEKSRGRATKYTRL